MREQLWPHVNNRSDIDAFFNKGLHTRSTLFIAESGRRDYLRISLSLSSARVC